MEKSCVCKECGCVKAEESKPKQNIFICQKCGKPTIWHGSDLNAECVQDRCHTLDGGRGGYGSQLDGCTIVLKVCDDCLKSWVDTFVCKDEIYSSGSNMDYDKLAEAYNEEH